MQTKYDLGDIVYIPYQICAISVEENGVKYKAHPPKEMLDQYKLWDGTAFLSEKDIDDINRKKGLQK